MSLSNRDPKTLLKLIKASNNIDALRPEETEHIRRCQAAMTEGAKELMPNDHKRLQHIASVICWD